MVAQKCKKKFWQNLFAFLNVYYPETHKIKALKSLDTSRPYRRPLENKKTGDSREFKNDQSSMTAA